MINSIFFVYGFIIVVGFLWGLYWVLVGINWVLERATEWLNKLAESIGIDEEEEEA